MRDRAFVDTNILVYAVDTRDAKKKARAMALLSDDPFLALSAQILNEFYSVATRKLRPALSPAEASAAVHALSHLTCVPVDRELVNAAVISGQRWQLSHWDALVVEAARVSGCNRVLTEDLATGASYDGITIENPFI
jgi:predicted nucleic acid-binding protein